MPLLFEIAVVAADAAAPVAPVVPAVQAAGDVLQYVQAAGPLGIAFVLAYLWKQFVAPVLAEQRADFDKALKAAEERAEKDREAHAKATREGMAAMTTEMARSLTDSIGRAGERVAAEARRIDDHLSAIANGAGCAAGAECAPPTPLRRAPSQPPVVTWTRRGGTVPPQASPFVAVEADRG